MLQMVEYLPHMRPCSNPRTANKREKERVLIFRVWG
jgi:hypothetical protein